MAQAHNIVTHSMSHESRQASIGSLDFGFQRGIGGHEGRQGQHTTQRLRVARCKPSGESATLAEAAYEDAVCRDSLTYFALQTPA